MDGATVIELAFVVNLVAGILVGFFARQSERFRIEALLYASLCVFVVFCLYTIGHEVLYGKGFLAGLGWCFYYGIAFAIFSSPAAIVCGLVQWITGQLLPH